MNITIDNVSLQKALQRLNRGTDFKHLMIETRGLNVRLQVDNGKVIVSQIVNEVQVDREGRTDVNLHQLLDYVQRKENNYVKGIQIIYNGTATAYQTDKTEIVLADMDVDSPIKDYEPEDNQYVAFLSSSQLAQLLDIAKDTEHRTLVFQANRKGLRLTKRGTILSKAEGEGVWVYTNTTRSFNPEHLSALHPFLKKMNQHWTVIERGEWLTFQGQVEYSIRSRIVGVNA